MILSGELAAGEFIAERPLAARLGMSTTPVRSALQRLEVDGLLSISPQQGAVVRELSLREIAELYEIRAALEPFVARHIAGRLTLEVLRRVGPNPTRQDFLAALAGIGAFDIGGFRLRYGPHNNRGSDQVFLTMIHGDGSIVPVEDMVR